MAYPRFISAGAVAVDTTGNANTTPTMPAHVANDILIVAVYNASGNAMGTVTAGWTEITEVDGTHNIAWYWKRATGSGTAGPTVTASGTDQFAIGYVIRGCITSGTPYEGATTAGNGTATSTTPTSATIDTLGQDRLAACFLAHDDDTAFSGGNPPAGWANADRTTDAGGTQVGFACITKKVPDIATVSSVTVGTLGVAEIWASLTLAFIPQPITWTASQPVTIFASKVPSDQTNFPMMFGGTYSYLKTVDNGGSIQSASGFDIAFFSDLALTTRLDFELDEYVSASTGECYFWVRIPSLSSSVNTVIYIAYGSADVVEDQSYAAGVWDSNYKGVYHFKNAVDSTSNNNTLTLSGTPPTVGTQKIAQGMSFNGTNQGCTPTTVWGFGGKTMTVDFWLKISSAVDEIVFEHSTNFNVVNGGWIFDPGGRSGWFLVSHGSVAPGYNGIYLNSNPTNDVWHYVSLVVDFNAGTGQVCRLFVDGVEPAFTIDSSADMSGQTLPAQNMYFMCRSLGSLFYSGQMDEARVSNSLRSLDYHITSYNNQSSPSTFYTVGVITIPNKIFQVKQAVNRASTY